MIEGQEGVTWQDWCALADACEEHGVDTLFRSDHYISQGDESRNVAHDAWTTIAALAARTSTLRFGTLVSPATFRAPGLLANAAATADHVSGGRIELGIGAGWMERIAEPDPVEHVPYRLRHGTHRLLHRLGDLVERLREVRKLLGEAEIRHEALVPDRPVPETLTLAPCGSRS